MKFEIWLLGNTQNIQKDYWNLLKTSKWNKDKQVMPSYSILEPVIESNPDFNNLPLLAQNIEQKITQESEEIIKSVQMLN